MLLLSSPLAKLSRTPTRASTLAFGLCGINLLAMLTAKNKFAFNEG